MISEKNIDFLSDVSAKYGSEPNLMSPVSQQGAEYPGNGIRERIFVKKSYYLKTGMAYIVWKSLDVNGDHIVRADTMRSDQVLDYIEKELLFEKLVDDITVHYR